MNKSWSRVGVQWEHDSVDIQVPFIGTTESRHPLSLCVRMAFATKKKNKQRNIMFNDIKYTVKMQDS